MAAVPQLTESSSRPRRPRVLLLYNRPQNGPAFHHLGQRELDALREALERAGFVVGRANLEDDVDSVDDAVVVHRPHLVFFLVDHMWGERTRPAAIAGMLELFGYAYTGSDPLALRTCLDRTRAQVLLEQAGVPVSPFAIVRDLDALADTTALGFPQIVTPARDDGYDDEGARPTLTSVEEVQAQARELASRFDLPLLVERHLSGRRISACVLGHRNLEVLPLTETDRSSGQERVWPVHLAPDLEKTLITLAQLAFRALGLRDVAQIDFVVDQQTERMWVIDVRPSVDLFGPVFKTASDASALGLPGALATIARSGLDRYKSDLTAAEAEGGEDDDSLASSAV